MNPPEWIDVSVPVRDGMVHWPDDPPVKIGLSLSIAGGDPANVTRLSASAHTGTHMDAPLHFFEDGDGIDALPLEATVGPARVIHIADPEAITADELAEHDLGEGERILLRTRNSDHAWWTEGFDPGFVHVEPAAAELVAAARVRSLGVDYLSVGGMESGAKTHRILLGAGVWIIEGLELSRVAAGRYQLVCLPMKLVRSDGAPARAVLRAIDAIDSIEGSES